MASDKLSRTEREVLAAFAWCATPAEVGDACNMQEATVKWHLTRIYRKLGIKNLVQYALHVARERGELEDQRPAA